MRIPSSDMIFALLQPYSLFQALGCNFCYFAEIE